MHSNQLTAVSQTQNMMQSFPIASLNGKVISDNSHEGNIQKSKVSRNSCKNLNI